MDFHLKIRKLAFSIDEESAARYIMLLPGQISGPLVTDPG